MIELAKHIEVLLLENDCVIVPGLGGFIAHNRQAEFKESENTFCSPARTIGFNPQLVMNDGLLVQTYMQAYNTDFPDATRKIEKIVSEIKEQLYKKGEVCLLNVGTLYYTMEGAYVFEPTADSFFTPYLYGLNNVTLPRLHELAATEEQKTLHTFIGPKRGDEFQSVAPTASVSNSYKRTFQRLVQHTVGVAAAIFLFFLLSVPVENTYMDDASYASLSAESMFDAIRGRSAATQLLSGDDDNTKHKGHTVHRTKSNVNTLKPVCVKSETVAPAITQMKTEKSETVAKQNNIIGKNKIGETKTSNKVTQKTMKEEVYSNNTTSKAKNEPATASKNTSRSTSNMNSSSAKFHVIVASLATATDAQIQLKKFQAQGFTGASVLENGNRYRVALYSYNKQADAYKKLKELRNQVEFKQAWLFTAK